MDHLKNPFRPQSNVKPDFAGLGDIFLSPEDAAKLRELERRTSNNEHRTSEPGLRTSDFELSLEEGMTAEERMRFQEAKELRETRKRLIAWADEFNLGGEEWVVETFKFNPDGTVICEGKLDLSVRGISYLPKGIKEVLGNLYLGDNQITKIENLPQSIGGNLYLSGNQITKIENLPASVGGYLSLSHNQITKIENLPASVSGNLDLEGNQITKIENLPASMGGGLDLSGNQITKIENLPQSIVGDLYLRRNQITKIENLPQSIGGDLNLRGIPAKQMQAGISVGGAILLSPDQTELKQDAESKGYKVIVYY